MQKEVPCKQSNPRVRPRLRPCQRQSLFSFHLRHTRDERRSWRTPNNDSRATLQFLLMSRAYFHVFFAQELKVVCEERMDAVCTTEIHKFFASAVDSLCFPAGEAMAALLRLSAVRRLEFKLTYVNPPLTRPMFGAIEKMPALESLDVDVYEASNSRDWLEGAFPTLPPSLARFKGRERDVQHLVGREHQCEEVVVVIDSGNAVLYPLNARKVVIKRADIDEFAEYEGPLPLECTEILEFPFRLEIYDWHATQRWLEGNLPQVVGGITRVIGERKAPFLLLKASEMNM
ncbi:hypothetical protein M3Y99_00752400 [Aphelenchoides fujianensis]|nr:hypothetical protein M3Y99_00752400 [Aphelenchoides fujianensis]